MRRVLPVLLVALVPLAAAAVAHAFAGTAGNAGNAATATPVFAPRVVEAPVLSGVAEVGGTLSASAGTWAREPAALAFAWLRCDRDGHDTSCRPVAGATARSYAPTADDEGTRLRVRVTATNAGGAGEATSVPSAPVAAPAKDAHEPVLTPAEAHDAAVLADQPYAFFALDDTPGAQRLADASGAGRDLALDTWSGGRVELGAAGAMTGSRAVLLDGTSAYRRGALPTGGDGATGDFTAELWFRPHSTAHTGTLLGNGGGADGTLGGVFVLQHADAVVLELARAGAVERVRVPGVVTDTTTWHHVAIRRAGTTTTLWIDGVQRAAGTQTPDARTGGRGWADFNLNATGYVGRFGAGWLDGVAWHTRALPEERIAARSALAQPSSRRESVLRPQAASNR